MIFLPGIDDLAEDFERRGFIEDIRQLSIADGAAAVDAHYGYYASRRLHDMIAANVVESARMQGYRQVWLVGISLGGFGAASYAASRPEDVAGLLLLAPYLGDAKLIREISGAGGLAKWEAGDVSEVDYTRRLWAWIKSEYLGGNSRIPLYLGYGEGDRFADAHRLLAGVIPSSRVFAIPGGHDWKTWTVIWRNFLSRKDEVFR